MVVLLQGSLHVRDRRSGCRPAQLVSFQAWPSSRTPGRISPVQGPASRPWPGPVQHRPHAPGDGSPSPNPAGHWDASHQGEHPAASAPPGQVSAMARGMGRRAFRRAVYQAGMGGVRPMLAYKTKWAGGQLVVADRWYVSSRIHHGCRGYRSDLRLGRSDMGLPGLLGAGRPQFQCCLEPS